MGLFKATSPGHVNGDASITALMQHPSLQSFKTLELER
jgi:hypothetical protein